MPRSVVIGIVGFCNRRAWWVIAIGLLLAAASTFYAVRHFAVATDIHDLFPRNIAWAKRAFEYSKTFPDQQMLVVVDAPTPELVDDAAARLARGLATHGGPIKSVRPLDSGPFFARNGFLFLPTGEVARLATGLAHSKGLVQTLAADPSLRGSLDALSYGLMGVRYGALKLDDLARPMTMAADTAARALAEKPASFSWQSLVAGQQPAQRQLRRFIEVTPRLDYRALEPGLAATDAIATTARRLNLSAMDQARVRVTGIVPINDDQFATLAQTAPLNAAVAILGVLLVLWLALRSLRIIAAVTVSLAAGLAVSAAIGLLLVGAFNVISVAFFVLFIGLGVDFGIQFSVRYRAERHDFGDLRIALLSAAGKAGGPLALAAAATAVGFASFLPTAYRGLGELGEIAGCGMVVAFLSAITLLPALLTVLKPPGERRPMGFAALAPVDRFVRRHRIGIVAGTLAAAFLASPLLLTLPFDFNPLHLRNADAPAVATFLALRKDPATGANAIDIAEPDLAAARSVASRLSKLPEVAATKTLDNLVPADQERKLGLVRMAAAALRPALNPRDVAPPPDDQQNAAALSATAGTLEQIAGGRKGPGAAAARRLAGLMTQLAKADPAARARVAAAFVRPLEISLAGLKEALAPAPITPQTVPPELSRQWLAPNGQARVEVLPKGDPNDTAVLRRFVRAVLAVAPNATGPAVLLFEAANTVVWAFVFAGIFALSAIALLLWITLRRISDVLLTLVPLILAGVVTLELCAAFGIALNFANIIALPLLLGVGVAFKIYYIMAWRSGKTALVQSSLTRAVMFSALATATAFGSLWLSRDPGTSSMGQLMALALVCTMAAAVLFQPALMGPAATRTGRGPGRDRHEPPAATQPPGPAVRAPRREPAMAGAEDRPPTDDDVDA